MKEDTNAVVVRFLPKIKKMARRLRAKFPGFAVDDLQQVGTQGLLKAMERYGEYDPKRSKLETWLHPWIQGAMLMHVRKDNAIRRYEREATNSVQDAIHKQAIGSGNSLAAELRDIRDSFAMDAYSRSGRTPEDECLTREAMAKVAAFHGELSERDREFFRLRYYEHLTLDEIGQALGRSVSRLSRLEQELREQLRRHMARGG